MESEELKTLVNRVINRKFESQTIELKKADGGCPKCRDTLSSFSNQDQGGTIIFGIDEEGNFNVNGVYDVADLEKRIQSQCAEMEPPVRAYFTEVEFKPGIFVVSAEIPACAYAKRPCYYLPAGRLGGSYVRVGEADEKMSEFEIYSYDAWHNRTREDLRVIKEASMADFDSALESKLLNNARKDRPNLQSIADGKSLELLGLAKEGKPTLAGLVALSHFPDAYFPRLTINVVRVPGKEMGSLADNGARFTANRSFKGAAGEMIGEAYDFVLANLKHYTIIGEDGRRADRFEYPEIAIREALLNAVEHRDYSRYSDSIPVSVEMYDDRLEIKNPGGILGDVDPQRLGEVTPETRNPALVTAMEYLGESENRFSGIPTIRKALEDFSLPRPIFEIKRGQFIAIFKNLDYLKEKGHSDPESILVFCQKPKTRSELAAFLGVGVNYAMSKFIIPLVQEGKLVLSMPEKPQSPLQTFVSK